MNSKVLVLYDMLGIFPGKPARFVKNYMEGAAGIEEAVANYVREVREGAFPSEAHGY